MTPNTPVSVMLDRERSIVFTQRALYRMGSLPVPFDFSDLQKSRKSYAALVAWLWACLSQSDAPDFETPADLAMHIPAEREVCVKLANSLAEAINAGATAKNGQSSTPGISPPSS